MGVKDIKYDIPMWQCDMVDMDMVDMDIVDISNIFKFTEHKITFNHLLISALCLLAHYQLANGHMLQ